MLDNFSCCSELSGDDEFEFVSSTSSQQAADVEILGTFTFASIIPSCSFPFSRVISTLFSYFNKVFTLLLYSLRTRFAWAQLSP